MDVFHLQLQLKPQPQEDGQMEESSVIVVSLLHQPDQVGNNKLN